jgi:hypothetical protein
MAYRAVGILLNGVPADMLVGRGLIEKGFCAEARVATARMIVEYCILLNVYILDG